MGPWGNSSNISTSSRNDTESAKGLKAGTNLTVNGGNNSGSESNGLYTDGIATSGTELTNFTLSSSVMTVSSTGATEGVSGGMRATRRHGWHARGRKTTKVEINYKN